MRTKVIIAILLLLMAISTIYASEDPTEQAEYLQKKQQLDLLAERFKAETGFKGDIETSCEQMKLSRFTGNFADIDMTNVRDSVAFRQVCNTVISKLLPFIGAKSEQLVPERINVDSRQIDTRYYQIVNGYKVESGGYLNIYYLCEQKRFGILNVTANITYDSEKSILPLQQIVDNLISYHKDKYKVVDRELVPYGDVTLKYSNIGTPQYKLTFIIVLDDITYYVDAYTGTICGAVSYVDDLSSVLVKGKVYNPCITNLSPEIWDNALAMQGIDVVFNGIHGYTDSDGIMTFPDSLLTSYEVFLKNPSYRISDYADSLTTLRTSDYNYMNHIYETVIGDSCRVNGIGKLCYAPNIFAHADAQIAFMKKLYSSYNANLLVITNYQFSNPNLGGQISYNTNKIRLKTGLIPNYLNHEFGHHFVWKALSTDFAPQSQLNANDESFAHYLSCVSIPWAKLIYPNGNNPFIYDLSLAISIDIWATTIGAIDEEKYSNYLCGLNIASAWWSLRNNPLFGLPNPETGVNAFDDILVKTLRQDVDPSFISRYKPRYFYNLLMQRVADTGQTTGLNEKQRTIDAAYSSRGLHFNPKVESFSGGNKGRNVYNLGDPVYAMLSNFPQNTAFTLYVIDHNSYNYVDGGFVPTSSCFAQGFTPISGTTDEDGNYLFTTPIWTANTEGDYDILVDIGSPTTPDGIIHFTFSVANVLDGIDGRTKPGFMVTDDGIDVVMAEQASAEAQLAEIHQ